MVFEGDISFTIDGGVLSEEFESGLSSFFEGLASESDDFVDIELGRGLKGWFWVDLHLSGKTHLANIKYEPKWQSMHIKENIFSSFPSSQNKELLC